MAPPTCGEIRTYLTAAAGPTPGSAQPGPGVWEALASHGAVSGSPGAPTVTPIGTHVLAELTLRAYRTDALSLDKFAGDLGRILEEFDAVAKAAEYFLQDLGPVVPALALPLLRPVAIGLANRRETPEELAEEFRNVWGGVEVMGGDPRDRLLAAELLNAAGAKMEQVYSPTLNATERIREKTGSLRPSVTPATILQLSAGADAPARVDAYLSILATAGSEEAAAMLAASAADPAPAVARRDAMAAALAPGGKPSGDALHAATLLIAEGGNAPDAGRVRAIAGLLGARVSSPLTAAALLQGHRSLSAEEIADWHGKATDVLQRWQIAPTEREIAALAVGMVHGLPESEYLAPSPPGSRPAAAPISFAALTAIHAWIYRPLLGSIGPVAANASPA